MKDDQATLSMLDLLRGWSLQAVSELPFRFWLLETDQVVMLLGTNDIIEKRLFLGREEYCERTEIIRSRGK